MADESVVGEARVDIIANMEGLRSDLKKVKSELSEIKKAGSGLAAKLTAVFTGISAFFNVFTAIFKIVGSIFSGIGKIVDVIVGALGMALKALMSIVKGVFNIIRAGLEMAVSGFKKLVGFIGQSVKVSADFRHQMQFVGAITRTLGTKDFDRLGEAALGLGKKTEFMASEAAQAMQTLARAGLSVDEIIDNTGTVLDMATGNMIGLADAASIIITTTNSMGYAVSDFNTIADHLAQAASIANTDVQLMADAFTNAGGAGLAAGASLQSVSSAILGLAAGGKQGFIAGSLMNQMMMRFAHKDAAKGFDRLNMSVFDTAGNLKDFHDIVGEFNRATANMTSEEKLTTATDIFGGEGAKGFLILAAQGEAAIKGFHEEVGKAQGRNKQMASDMRSDVKTAFDIVGSSFEALQIRLGDAFAPLTKDALGVFTRVLDQIADLIVQWTPWIQENLEKLWNWVSANLRTFIKNAASTIAFFWNDIMGGFATVKNWIGRQMSGTGGLLNQWLGLDQIREGAGGTEKFFTMILNLFGRLGVAWDRLLIRMKSMFKELMIQLEFGARTAVMKAGGAKDIRREQEILAKVTRGEEITGAEKVILKQAQEDTSKWDVVVEAWSGLNAAYSETLRDWDKELRKERSAREGRLEKFDRPDEETGLTPLQEMQRANREWIKQQVKEGAFGDPDKWSDVVAGWYDTMMGDAPPASKVAPPSAVTPPPEPKPEPKPDPKALPALVMAGTISTVFGAMRVSFDRQVALLTQIAKNTKQTATQTTQPATAGHGHGPNPLG
jgi:TP901 family phage tail tape measure protein